MPTGWKFFSLRLGEVLTDAHTVRHRNRASLCLSVSRSPSCIPLQFITSPLPQVAILCQNKSDGPLHGQGTGGPRAKSHASCVPGHALHVPALLAACPCTARCFPNLAMRDHHLHGEQEPWKRDLEPGSHPSSNVN